MHFQYRQCHTTMLYVINFQSNSVVAGNRFLVEIRQWLPSRGLDKDWLLDQLNSQSKECK